MFCIGNNLLNQVFEIALGFIIAIANKDAINPNSTFELWIVTVRIARIGNGGHYSVADRRHCCKDTFWNIAHQRLPIFFYLLRGASANDDGGNPWLVQHPADRQMG
jgi:hypothetical protein